jgi:hypothetical protein
LQHDNVQVPATAKGHGACPTHADNRQNPVFDAATALFSSFPTLPARNERGTGNDARAAALRRAAIAIGTTVRH